MIRPVLATQIASGLAGWHQLQTVQSLGGLSGEDSARSLVAQIVNAQGHFAPATSQLPPNWGNTKKRIDIALLGRSKGAVVWYGAIEIKWPGSAFDRDEVRERIVQDAMRLSFIETNGLNAKFLVLGGNTTAINDLFDTAHPNAVDSEARRIGFKTLFSRNPTNPKVSMPHGKWSKLFPEAGKRIPQTTFQGFDGNLKTELLASVDATIASNSVGKVFIWQCNRSRGTATQLNTSGGAPHQSTH